MYFISIPDAVIIEVFSFFYLGGGQGVRGPNGRFFWNKKMEKKIQPKT